MGFWEGEGMEVVFQIFPHGLHACVHLMFCKLGYQGQFMGVSVVYKISQKPAKIGS